MSQDEKTVDTLRQRMLAAEHLFREEQQRLTQRFIHEQRRVFEESLDLLARQGSPSPAVARDMPRCPASVSSISMGAGERLIPERSATDFEEEKTFTRSGSEYEDSDSDTDSSPRTSGTKGAEIPVLRSKKDVSNAVLIVPRTKLQKLLLPITESSAFAAFSSVLVLSVCLQLGMDVHFRMSAYFDKEGANDDINRLIKLWQLVNLFLFIFEIALRIGGEWRDFFIGVGYGWNLFDLSLLIFTCSTFFLANTPLSCLRVIRIFRMIRVFEVFPDLRMMFFSILACLSSVCWSMVLMTLFMWMFSCYLMEMALINLPNLDSKDTAMIHEHWGGMFSSIVSLVFTITGGLSWGDLSAPYFNMNRVIGASYMVFVIVFLLGFWNILVGIFVQKSDDLSGWDLDGVLASALDDMNREKENLQTLFDEINQRGAGEITAADLEEGLQRARIQAYFRHLKIDDMDPRLFFKKLDCNHNGFVDREEFTQGCLRLQGAAKPAEVAEILSLSQAIEGKLSLLLHTRMHTNEKSAAELSYNIGQGAQHHTNSGMLSPSATRAS